MLYLFHFNIVLYFSFFRSIGVKTSSASFCGVLGLPIVSCRSFSTSSVLFRSVPYSQFSGLREKDQNLVHEVRLFILGGKYQEAWDLVRGSSYNVKLFCLALTFGGANCVLTEVSLVGFLTFIMNTYGLFYYPSFHLGSGSVGNSPLFPFIDLGSNVFADIRGNNVEGIVLRGSS